MAPKGGADGSKKAQGQARKAAQAADKQAAAETRAENDEAEKWQQGAKSHAKKDAAADKAAEAQRKKAEKAALLAEEEASLPSKGKAAPKKKSKGLDLSALEGMPGWNAAGRGGKAEDKKKPDLNATGIDNALDALSLTNSSNNDKVDRHPERRFKAAYAAFEERRLAEMADEKGLRRQQKIDQIRKEFERSPENPFNQAMAGRYDMSKDEMKEVRERENEAKETRLTQPRS